MPLYDFECESCGAPFEALVTSGGAAACPECGSERTVRRWSPIARISDPLRLTPKRKSGPDTYRRTPQGPPRDS